MYSHRPGELAFDVVVRVPVAAATAVDLYEAHIPLREATGHQTQTAEGPTDLGVDTVEFLGGLALLIEVGDFQSFDLHTRGQLVVCDARFQFLIERVRGLLIAIQRLDRVQEAPLLVGLMPSGRLMS
jgi:hypothetical protein